MGNLYYAELFSAHQTVSCQILSKIKKSSTFLEVEPFFVPVEIHMEHMYTRVSNLEI